MSIMRLFTFILSIFIVGMVEMMVAGIMNLMSQGLTCIRSCRWSISDNVRFNICDMWTYSG